MVIVHSQKVYVGFVLHTARKKILFKNVKSVFRFREWMNDGKFFFNNPSINSFFPVKLCRLKKRTNVKKKNNNKQNHLWFYILFIHIQVFEKHAYIWQNNVFNCIRCRRNVIKTGALDSLIQNKRVGWMFSSNTNIAKFQI